MKQRRPDDVIRRSADADPMSKTIIGPMKLSVIGPMKHPSRARHRADEVVLVGKQHRTQAVALWSTNRGGKGVALSCG